MHHEFLGLYLDEWASLIAIGGGVGTALALIMRAVLQPIKSSIDNLTNAIKEITSNTHQNTRRIEDLEDRLEVHIGEAKVRNQRITALEKEIFNHAVCKIKLEK